MRGPAHHREPVGTPVLTADHLGALARAAVHDRDGYLSRSDARALLRAVLTAVADHLADNGQQGVAHALVLPLVPREEG